MIATAWPFIELNEERVPLIKGTLTKVTEIVAEHVAYRWDADQLHRQHPDLSLPQIHAVLGYYYEHQQECDRQIAEGVQRAEEICRQHDNPALTAKLRSHSGK